jgi:hypothetical protein
LIAAAFRTSFGNLIHALGSRVTKLSLFKVEFELAPAIAATSMPLLDEIRTGTAPAVIADSAKAMLEQAQSTTPADFAEIAIGGGKEWLTSRLYIAAVMMERMRGMKVFVFVERGPATERRFLAVAPVRELRWALACRYPWLEAAWVAATKTAFPAPWRANAPNLPEGAEWAMNPSSSVSTSIVSETGAFAPYQARSLVEQFITSLQKPPPQNELVEGEWVALRGGSIKERAEWVTHEMLESLLPRQAFNMWAPALPDAPRAKRTRSVLRRKNAFVALVQDDREFYRLVNRQALLEEIAASYSEEPETAGGL